MISAISGQLWYRLSSAATSYGLRVNRDGAFLGPVPLLARSSQNGEDVWICRPIRELNATLTNYYDFPIDLMGKVGGLAVIASALNKGNLVLARIAAVQLRLPDLPNLERSGEHCGDSLEYRLHNSGMLKKEWDPEEHPHWPAGAPDSQGGEFRPVNDEDTSDGEDDGGVAQLSPDCLAEWAQARLRCESLLTSGLLGASGYRGFGMTIEQCVRGQVSARCGGNPIG